MILGNWGKLGIYGAVGDTTAPSLTVDTTPIYIEVFSTFTAPVATATDNKDGDISANIVVTDNVDTTTLGQYEVSYSVTDSDGNTSPTVTVEVNVVDTTPAQLSLVGDSVITIPFGSNYTDQGATGVDNVDGTFVIESPDTVDTQTAGTYTLTYTYTDSSGNESSQITRTVIVEEQISSVLKLTILGIGTGQRSMVLHDRSSRSVVFDGDVDFVDDSADIAIYDVQQGTEIYGVWFGVNPPVTGTGIYGVTQ